MNKYDEAYVKDKQEVFTTGFPRSGSTWLNRTLSDMLHAPLQTKPEEQIEYFGPTPHDGDYVIRKTHFYANQYNGVGYSGRPAKMILIERDPRDMAVSVMFYRRVQPDLMSVLRSVFLDQNIPGIPVIGFCNYINGWENSNSLTIRTQYEKLQYDGPAEIKRIYKAITGKNMSIKRAKEVHYRQRFDRWKDRYPHSMRKGVSGDWRDHFTQRDGAFLTASIGDIMIRHGYIENMDWWKELPK